MKRMGLFILTAMLLGWGTPARAAEAPQISAKAAVVYDADYGRVLYEKNMHTPMRIASTTKIMTAMVVLEQCDLEETVTVTSEMAEVEGSSMYLRAGEDYTVRELLYGLMLASGNDAATALAVHAAGDTQSFAELMNETARIIGMTNTSFENPHGLDGERHYSTALDMALLMAYAMNNSTFAEIAGTRSISIKGLTYVNHNKLLWQCEGVIGGKTGYTMAAGRTLVTCCEREGQRLICVTLSDPDDWNDHPALYDSVYGKYSEYTVVDGETRYLLPLFYGDGRRIAVEPLQDVRVFAEHAEDVKYIVELPRFVFGPVYMGDRAGRVLVRMDGKTVEEVPLVYMENSE